MFNAKVLSNTPLLLMPDEVRDCLYLIWNKDDKVEIEVDGMSFTVQKNCIIFISEFHMEISARFDQARVIQFDKSFLGLDNSLNQVGDYLLIFYGYHFLDHVPKIQLSEEEALEFDRIWGDMIREQEHSDNPTSLNLLRNSFQRLMLLSQKIHASTEFDLPIETHNLRIVREYQYLIETNFKTITRVADYADIMKISPKKIAEIFNTHYGKKPSELIAYRRNLYAKKQLLHTNELIKNIAFDLNFSDSQAFSHFFKRQNGVTPEAFRLKHLSGK